jgi:hypothetical protein
MCNPLSLLGNGSVNTSPRERIHATIEDLLEASFPIRSLSHKGRVYGSVFSIFLSFFSCDFLEKSKLLRFRASVGSCGFCGQQSGTGEIFSEYFCFPCQYAFHRLLHNHHHTWSDNKVGELIAAKVLIPHC